MSDQEDIRAPHAAQRSKGSPRGTLIWSGQDIHDGLSIVDVQSPPAGHFEAPGIEAKLVHDRGMDVGDIMALFNGVESQSGRWRRERRPP